MTETDLTLEIIENENALPPFSSRECTQTLMPIPHGTLRRTINGTLIYLGNGQHRKFQSTISCKDKVPPAFEGFWKGTCLKVGCIQFMTQTVPKGTQQIQLEREALSLRLYDISGKMWPVKSEEKQLISLPSEFPGGFITYRPLLAMIVKNYHLETDEWGLSVGWTLELEEQ